MWGGSAARAPPRPRPARAASVPARRARCRGRRRSRARAAALLVAPRGELVGLGRHQPGDEALDDGRRLGAGELVDHLSMPERLDRREARECRSGRRWPGCSRCRAWPARPCRPARRRPARSRAPACGRAGTSRPRSRPGRHLGGALDDALLEVRVGQRRRALLRIYRPASALYEPRALDDHRLESGVPCPSAGRIAQLADTRRPRPGPPRPSRAPRTRAAGRRPGRSRCRTGCPTCRAARWPSPPWPRRPWCRRCPAAGRPAWE